MGKQRIRLVLRGLLLLAIAFAILAPAQAQKPEYRVVLLHDWLSPSTCASGASSVSEDVVVGWIVPDTMRSSETRAFVWNLGNKKAYDLLGPGMERYNNSRAWSISGESIVGEAFLNQPHTLCPLLWDKRTRRVTRLVGPNQGVGRAMAGNLVVGSGTFSYPRFDGRSIDLSLLLRTLFSGNPRWGQHDRREVLSATVWNRTNNRVVSLHDWLDKGYYAISVASDISGNLVVGWAYTTRLKPGSPVPELHTIVWNLATRTGIALQRWTPTGFTNPEVESLCGQFGVGQAYARDDSTAAFLWNLDTGVATNLHSQLSRRHLSSTARKIAGTFVVGTALPNHPPYNDTAILWNLATRRVTNLHQEYLASVGFKDSEATAVDSDGVIVGTGTRKGQVQAWALIPTARHPRESKPLPTVNVGETPLWLWLASGLFIVLPVALVMLWVRARRRHRANTPMTDENGKPTSD